VLEKEVRLPFDRSRDIGPARGREQLGITEHQAHLVKQAESLNLVKLALQAGKVNEMWEQASASCLEVLAHDPRCWEVMGALGLLESIAGRAEKGRKLIEQAMASNPYVKSSYVFFWKTEPPYQKAFADAGLDMAAVEASLTPEQARQLENRIFHSASR
jgi:hypothetical protein